MESTGSPPPKPGTTEPPPPAEPAPDPAPRLSPPPGRAGAESPAPAPLVTTAPSGGGSVAAGGDSTVPQAQSVMGSPSVTCLSLSNVMQRIEQLPCRPL